MLYFVLLAILSGLLLKYWGRAGNVAAFFTLLGSAAGFVLRCLGRAGQILFWLILLYFCGWMIGLLSLIIRHYLQARKDHAPFTMPYSGLVEYALLLPWPVGGVASSYWVSASWTMDYPTLVGTLFVLGIGAFITYRGVFHLS